MRRGINKKKKEPLNWKVERGGGLAEKYNDCESLSYVETIAGWLVVSVASVVVLAGV